MDTVPVLLPMSEIAGRLAPIIAGQLLMNIHGGRGTLLSGIPGVTRGSVAILGAGVLGSNAARAFLGIGAQVIVLDNNLRKLERVDELLNGRITTMMATHTNLDRITKFTDVLVGAIQQPGRRAEQLVSREMVRGMRPGSVILDFSIDDGGCVETSRPTTLRDPIFVAEGVIHYCVPNAPAAVARTTSYGLTNALLPYLKDIGQTGIVGMLEKEPGFANGINLYQGNLTHPQIAAALDREIDCNIFHWGIFNEPGSQFIVIKLPDVDTALAAIKSNDRIYLGGGAGVPKVLIEGLTNRADQLRNVEITHILTFADAPYAAPGICGFISCQCFVYRTQCSPGGSGGKG